MGDIGEPGPHWEWSESPGEDVSSDQGSWSGARGPALQLTLPSPTKGAAPSHAHPGLSKAL